MSAGDVPNDALPTRNIFPVKKKQLPFVVYALVVAAAAVNFFLQRSMLIAHAIPQHECGFCCDFERVNKQNHRKNVNPFSNE